VGHAYACLNCISYVKRGFCLSEIELWKPVEEINHKKSVIANLGFQVFKFL